MAAPQQPYPPQGFSQDQYGQQAPQPGFAEPGNDQEPMAHADGDTGKKKKSRYAAQAYDFGAGGNAALGGQMQGGGTFQPAAPAPAASYGGYDQQAQQQPAYGGAPQYGAPLASPAMAPPGQAPYGQPQYGGYQPPDAGYAGTAASPNIGGITQGMGQMNMGPATPQMQSAPGPARPMQLNQLYPTDLVNQPLNVAELDLPPPPIILPPNVSKSILQRWS